MKHPFPKSGGAWRWDGENLVPDNATPTDVVSVDAVEYREQASDAEPHVTADAAPYFRRKKTHDKIEDQT